jgi:hypothetical protein
MKSLITQMIRYKNGSNLELQVKLESGNEMSVPVYGIASRTIQESYDLEVIEVHETYDVVIPRLKKEGKS